MRRSLLIASAAILLLAGCSGGVAAPFGAQPRNAVRRASGTSGALLYVSDWRVGRILIFNYPAGTLAETIADAQYPLGLCSDANGNVWVVNFGSGSNQLIEYAHGGTTPIATLDDPSASPRSCSVDPITGNLAVANSNPSSVVVYPNASGTPQSYTPRLAYPFACAYDGAGDLFVDGYRLQGVVKFALSVLPSGLSQFTRIKLPTGLGLPGSLQWDGLYLAAGDSQSPGSINRLTISKNFKTATLEGTVTLRGPVRQPPEGVQFLIDGATLIMPFSAKKYVDEIGLWNYPAGGEHVAAWRGFGPAEFFGVTLSVLPSR